MDIYIIDGNFPLFFVNNYLPIRIPLRQIESVLLRRIEKTGYNGCQVAFTEDLRGKIVFFGMDTHTTIRPRYDFHYITPVVSSVT